MRLQQLRQVLQLQGVSPSLQRTLSRSFSDDYRTRHQKEQLSKSNSIGRLILLGIALGVVGTIIRIKVMAANPPPKHQKQVVANPITKNER